VVKKHNQILIFSLPLMKGQLFLEGAVVQQLLSILIIISCHALQFIKSSAYFSHSVFFTYFALILFSLIPIIIH